MLLSEKAMSGKAAKNPLPPKIARLVRESGWLALLTFALYLTLVLYTYHRGDPGWAHGTASAVVQNAGGRMGAWLSDVLLFLFGLSAYWWVALCGFLVWRGFRRIEDHAAGEHGSRVVTAIGFAIVLAASSGLEAIRLYSLKVALPDTPGGMLGTVVGHAMMDTVGFTGSTLILLLAFAAGLSLFTGVSWLTVIERLGTWAEALYQLALQKLQERADRRAGEQAVVRREEVVEESKKKLEVREPVRSEPPAPEIPKSPR